MSIGSLKELYLVELGVLYDAETQMLRAIPRFVEMARSVPLREALEKHWLESRLHLDRLELIFTHWGERLVPRVADGVRGIVQEADERLNEAVTQDARDAAVIGAVQRLEHYEIASYGCVRTYARRLNRPDEARLLQETLDEEARADRLLTDIASARINDDARTEPDLHEQRHSRLGYVSAGQLDCSQLSAHALEIHNVAGEDLGEFDGLLIDVVSRRPSYVVVDASGLFGAKKYLLPVGQVWYDSAMRTLRIDLDRDVAERYPAFDADQFAAMSGEQVERYEQDLPTRFPARPNARITSPDGLLPEWLARVSAIPPRSRPRRATRLERVKAADGH